MQKELDALESNHTWELTTLPMGKKPLGSKWVYEVKFRLDGNAWQYKARVVAKGYNQVEGIDFVHTFFPIAKLTTLRLLLALVAIKG